MATLLLFGQIRETLQEDTIEIGEQITTIAELKTWLIETSPQLKNALDNVIWAKNEEYVEISERVEQGDTIAIIPPVSGG